MRMLLDGCDWQADYFIAHENYKKWVSNARLQHNQLMDSVFTSDFIKPDYDGAGCLTGTIPGCDRTFLEENGLSEDTYFARNLEKTRWVENHAWAFRKKFFLPESWKECRRIILKCRGLDYEANILVNGFGAGYHKGMFIPAELDITELVKSGESNLLVIGFEQQMDQLFRNESIDISSDIGVLERMMAMDGLDGRNDFQIKPDAPEFSDDISDTFLDRTPLPAVADCQSHS